LNVPSLGRPLEAAVRAFPENPHGFRETVMTVTNWWNRKGGNGNIIFDSLISKKKTKKNFVCKVMQTLGKNVPFSSTI